MYGTDIGTARTRGDCSTRVESDISHDVWVGSLRCRDAGTLDHSSDCTTTNW
jgi:hypothetical protein